MPQDVKIWEVGVNDDLTEILDAKLDLEERLENWLEKDISIISNDLLVIGRQVETDFGGIIDLLCLDSSGDIVIVELKKDKTPREIVAQVLDYASWIQDLSVDKISDIFSGYSKEGKTLDQIFNESIGNELPENLNQNHKMYIVASELDGATERVVSYLANCGIGINAVTFKYFKKDNKEFLSRVFLVPPEIADMKSKSKRRKNLTEKELMEIATDYGINEIYSMLVNGLTPYFDRVGTTRSSMTFVGKLNESTVATIFSLIPVGSTEQNGLRFRMYLQRFSTYFKIEKTKVVSILPKQHKEWKYSTRETRKDGTPHHSGYEGFFQTMDEAQHFLNEISKIQK